MRRLRGPMADWGITEMLLRRIDLSLAGANWQRAGGKGARPKPIPLPDEGRPVRRDPLALQKLRALGLLDDNTKSE